MRKNILIIILVIMSCLCVKAQGPVGADHALAAAWRIYTQAQKASYAGATAATAATIPEIEWYKSKTREYVDFRKKYYLYLDSIQNKLLIYVNAVGLGLEINDLIKSFNMVTKELKENPTNFLALSLDRTKKQTLMDVIQLIEELNSNFIAIGQNRAKLKETERYKPLENIRKKIREISANIRRLAYDVHITNFYYLYRKWLNDYEFREVDKGNVAYKCISVWKANGKVGIKSFD